MKNQNTELVNLLYTRISHDLSGSIGAIYNGTEMLMEDLSLSPDMSLVLQNSAQTLMNRLVFFRQTFGMPVSTADDTTAKYLKTLSVPVALSGCCVNALQRSLCIILGDMLPKGGKIEVTENSLIASGAVLKEIKGLKDILEKGAKTDKPEEAPALYAFYLAKQDEKSLSFSFGKKDIKIKIIQDPS